MKALTTIFFMITLSFAKINTYKADFTQSITNLQNKTIKYTGKIYLKQPYSMLWQYKTPIQKDVYMKNKKIIIDEPQLEQAIYTTLTNEINLINLLNNPKLINKKYKLTFKDKILQTIQYKDEMENKITITFSNTQINQQIPDQLFQFIAPLDYDIVRKGI
jgi:outer membrane lipoprotein carrier protein